MITTQVIACFVIYSNQQIVYQGTFQVSELLNWLSFPSTDGGEFEFSHSYNGGTQCEIEVSYKKDGSIENTRELVIPINRTKIKWKQTDLGARYQVYYRCQLESWDSEKLTKQQKKQRRKAVTRDNGQTVGTIYYVGENPNGDA